MLTSNPGGYLKQHQVLTKLRAVSSAARKFVALALVDKLAGLLSIFFFIKQLH